MVKVGMFNHQISRTIGSRARMTGVRNNIAALRGSSYAPYEQDRLNLEVKHLAGLQEMDSNSDGEISLFERSSAVVSLPVRAAFYELEEDEATFSEAIESSKASMGNMNATQSGRIEMLNKKVQERQRLVGNYEIVLEQYRREVGVLRSTSTSEYTKLGKFLVYLNANIRSPQDVVSTDGKTFTELKAKYDRDSQIITDAKANIENLESQMKTLQEKIDAQDRSIQEAAIVAGVDYEGGGLLKPVGDVLSSSIPPAMFGAIAAIAGLAIISGMRGPSAPRRGRRGSAMQVFMGR